MRLFDFVATCFACLGVCGATKQFGRTQRELLQRTAADDDLLTNVGSLSSSATVDIVRMLFIFQWICIMTTNRNHTTTQHVNYVQDAGTNPARATMIVLRVAPSMTLLLAHVAASVRSRRELALPLAGRFQS